MPQREGARAHIRIKVTPPKADPEIFVTPSRLEAEFRNVPLGEQRTAALQAERRFGDIPQVQVVTAAPWIRVSVNNNGVLPFTAHVTVDTTGLKESETYHDDILFIVNGDVLVSVPVILRVESRAIKGGPQARPTQPKPKPKLMIWGAIIIFLLLCIGLVVVPNLPRETVIEPTIQAPTEEAQVIQDSDEEDDDTPMSSEEWTSWTQETFPTQIISDPEFVGSNIVFSATIHNKDEEPHTVVASFLVNIVWDDGESEVLPKGSCTGFHSNPEASTCATEKFDIGPGESVEINNIVIEGYEQRPFQVTLLEPSVFLVSVDGDRVGWNPRPKSTRDKEKAEATAAAANIQAGQEAVESKLVRATVEDLMVVRSDHGTVETVGLFLVINNETDRRFNVDVEFTLRFDCENYYGDNPETYEESIPFIFSTQDTGWEPSSSWEGPLIEIGPNLVVRQPISMRGQRDCKAKYVPTDVTFFRLRS